MANIITELVATELDKNGKRVPGKPYILGKDMKELFHEIMQVVEQTTLTHYFLGPPGSGKSHMMKQILLERSRKTGKPSFLTIADEDSTKGSFLQGKQIVNGSLETVDAVVAHAMQVGGSVGVDELPHGPMSVQSVFNSVIDPEGYTTIGDKRIEKHPDFRLFLGGNNKKYAGNSAHKPSLAGRVVVWPFDYPSRITEVKIAKSIAYADLGKATVDRVPDSVIMYLTGYAAHVRELTNGYLPVSARNVAAATMLLALASRDEQAQLLPEYAQGGTAINAIRSKVAEWVYFKPVASMSTADLVSEPVNDVLAFISQIGKKRFIDKVMQCSMALIDIDGITKKTMEMWIEQMVSSIAP